MRILPTICVHMCSVASVSCQSSRISSGQVLFMMRKDNANQYRTASCSGRGSSPTVREGVDPESQAGVWVMATDHSQSTFTPSATVGLLPPCSYRLLKRSSVCGKRKREIAGVEWQLHLSRFKDRFWNQLIQGLVGGLDGGFEHSRWQKSLSAALVAADAVTKSQVRFDVRIRAPLRSLHHFADRF